MFQGDICFYRSYQSPARDSKKGDLVKIEKKKINDAAIEDSHAS